MTTSNNAVRNADNQSKTVSMLDQIIVPTKKFFGTNYSTLELMTEKEIEENILRSDKSGASRGHDSKHFVNDGVNFYLYTFTENGKVFRTINRVSNSACLSGGECWKFGCVKEDGTIVMFFDNQFVVRGRKQAIEMFQRVREFCALRDCGIPFANKS